MTKKVSEMSSKEIKSAVKDAYADLANRTEEDVSSSESGPQASQSGCCGPSQSTETFQKERLKNDGTEESK
ncbi:MAG: hypothetical protein KAR33_06910 [Candidatus Thorarchaeota archaeon]|nr:hypothetical protein [Candidatus Thorarchaeota archaeon]